MENWEPLLLLNEVVQAHVPKQRVRHSSLSQGGQMLVSVLSAGCTREYEEHSQTQLSQKAMVVLVQKANESLDWHLPAVGTGIRCVTFPILRFHTCKMRTTV